MQWIAPVWAIFRSRTPSDAASHVTRGRQSMEDWVEVTPSEVRSDDNEVPQSLDIQQDARSPSESGLPMTKQVLQHQSALPSLQEGNHSPVNQRSAAAELENEFGTLCQHHRVSEELRCQFRDAQEGCAEAIYTIRTILRDLLATIDNDFGELRTGATPTEESRNRLQVHLDGLDERIRLLRSVEARVSSLEIEVSNTAHCGFQVDHVVSLANSSSVESDDTNSTASSSSSKAPSVIRDYISAAREVFLVKERIERLSSTVRATTLLKRSFLGVQNDSDVNPQSTMDDKSIKLRKALKIAQDEEEAHKSKCIAQGYNPEDFKRPRLPRSRIRHAT